MAAQRGSSGVDTTFTKIFVGGLAWETQCETMRRYFEQFGEIVEAVVITDKTTGRSKGYGFVTFRDPEAARRACMDPAPIIDGRRTNCNLAALGAHRSRPTSPLFQGTRFIPYMGDFGGQMYHGGGGAPHFGQPLHFPYPQGFPFPPPFGYPPYGPEFYGAQGMYPFMGPQFPSIYTPQSPFHQLHDSQGAGTIAPPQAQAMTPLSPPHPPLIGSPYIPSHVQPHLVPIPFHSPTGVVPTPGPSSQRFGLPSPSAQPFTPGGSSEQSSG